MKFKVGDYAQPKSGYAEECTKFNDNNGSYIKIDDVLWQPDGYEYHIYDNSGNYIRWCKFCFDDDNLKPYTPTPAQLKAMRPKQTKPQLTYKKDIIYTRSDGIVFKEDGITYNDEFTSVETLRLYSNLYKAWKGRKFDE